MLGLRTENKICEIFSKKRLGGIWSSQDSAFGSILIIPLVRLLSGFNLWLLLLSVEHRANGDGLTKTAHLKQQKADKRLVKGVQRRTDRTKITKHPKELNLIEDF